MKRTEINIKTGEIKEINLSEEEMKIINDKSPLALQEAKDSKITELKANKQAADLQDHHHDINSSWYSFHMDLESRNLLSSILSSAASMMGLDPNDPNDDNVVVYSGFGVSSYNEETKEKGDKASVDLTFKDLRSLYAHMAVRLRSVYALYIQAKDDIEALTDPAEVSGFDVSINYEAK